jgi:hypothetical protein
VGDESLVAATAQQNRGVTELAFLQRLDPSDRLAWRTTMKAILASVCLLLALSSISPADAKGCIKGAVVGGVAGHMAGHGKLGAAAGCVIGHHEANKPNPNNANAQAPSGQK